MTSFILVFKRFINNRNSNVPSHVFGGNKNQQEISTMLHFRTHSVLGNQFPEFSVWKDKKPFNLKVTAAFQQLTEISTEWKIAFFLHFHRQEKGGMRFYFENTPWPVKEGCIRWRVFWICPKTGSGQPIFRDIIYLLRQHSCLPQDNFLQAHAKFPKVPLAVYYTRRGN